MLENHHSRRGRVAVGFSRKCKVEGEKQVTEVGYNRSDLKVSSFYGTQLHSGLGGGGRILIWRGGKLKGTLLVISERIFVVRMASLFTHIIFIILYLIFVFVKRKLRNNLRFDEHISSISKKSAQRVGVLMRLRNLIPTQTKLQLYKAAVLPYLTYCHLIWHFFRASDSRRLGRIQERALRAIY